MRTTALLFLTLLASSGSGCAHCSTIQIDRAPALERAGNALETYHDYLALPDLACTNPDPEGFWQDFDLRVRQAICHPSWDQTSGARPPCDDPANEVACREEKEAFVEECGRDLTAKAKVRGVCP